MKDELIPLHDILKEVAFLHYIRERTTFENFKDDPAYVRAAYYSVLVISEATRRIPYDWLEAYPDIPWHALRAIGNKLRHEYQRVSESIIWGIIETHAQPLKDAIEDMVSKREGERLR